MHEVEHGSDHRAIETTFDIAPPERIVVQRLLLKNAPWNAIRQRIATAFQSTPLALGIQAQIDQLMTIVLEAIHALTPKAKPSPYAKRGGGPPTSPTSGEHILIRGTKLEPTEELELYLKALSSGHARQLRSTMTLFGGRRRPTGRNSYRTTQTFGRQLGI